MLPEREREEKKFQYLEPHTTTTPATAAATATRGANGGILSTWQSILLPPPFSIVLNFHGIPSIVSLFLNRRPL